MVDSLAIGREAVARRAWTEARDAFVGADAEAPLVPADLELLADAAWWAGHPDDATEALERAYAGYLDIENREAAAAVAIQLAYLAFRRVAMAVATGWISRATRLVEGAPPSPVHASLAVMQLIEAILSHRSAGEMLERADLALALTKTAGIRSAEALALSLKGSVLIMQGAWKEGMALVDEATAAAVSGDVDLRSACDIYCNTISTCATLSDYRRAAEWTEQADRWMNRHSLSGYPGICKVYRASLKKLQGSYGEAEAEARIACEELERHHLHDALGAAHAEVGEVRLRMGDLDAAEDSFLMAYEYGGDAQPGLALLMLARGDVAGAASAMRSRLVLDSAGDTPDIDRLLRARLLPAQITIALADGDVEAARAATVELEELAAAYDRPAFHAAALTGTGAIELHVGNGDQAAAALDRSWRIWRDIELPYESAHARLLLGRARQLQGDEAAARREIAAARATFRGLGAALDVRQAEDLLGGGPPGGSARAARVTKTFMFTDIVMSTDLIGLIGDSAWEDLLRWHDRALRSEIERHHGRVVRTTGDGFFAAFDLAADAVAGGVAIQRRLGEHRAEHGFAPWVRIGLHTAEASIQGADFAGQGVHIAARIGELGGREEVIVTAETLRSAGTMPFRVSEGSTVALKGVGEAVEVHNVDWQHRGALGRLTGSESS